MPLSATMVGALLGLGTQMYSNALRKLPYMRHPWEHLLGIGLGVVAANQMVKWEAKSNEDLDKLLEKSRLANERRYFEALFGQNYYSYTHGKRDDQSRLHLFHTSPQIPHLHIL
uniref:Uncharacterized protein n=1 Tax=Solanum tuberosum TaxID=4113 RepID=M1ASK6_SOLTU